MKAIRTLKTLGLCLPVAALCAFTVPAHAADSDYTSKTSVKQNADGSYDKKTTEESTDANGTSQSSEVKENVDVDSNGETTTARSTSNTVDPKGLGNKLTTEAKENTTEKANGEIDSKVVSDREDNAGAHDRTETTKTVSNNSAGRKHVKAVTKKIHDPKGLMNKTVQKTTDTSDEKANGQVEMNHKTEVNGSVTESSSQTQ